MNWSHFNIAFFILFGVFIIGIPVWLLLRDLFKLYLEHRQNRKWLKHCGQCLYFRRIQFTSLDKFHKRGVVCDNGIDFEYTEDPMRCERFKRKPL